MRKLVSRMEAWKPGSDEEGAELIFSHWNYIWTENDEFYYAISKDRYNPAVAEELEGKHIPNERVYARIQPQLTLAPDPLPADLYMKTHAIHYSDEDSTRSDCLGDVILAEAKLFEFLKQHPHPNIVQYFGCATKDGFLTGVALKRYDKTVADMVKDGYKFSDKQIGGIVLGINAAVSHLHRHGYAHNDVNSHNVMLDEELSPNLIDFDSCAPEGAALMKTGTPGWTKDGQGWAISSKYKDKHALNCIELYLRGKYYHMDHF